MYRANITYSDLVLHHLLHYHDNCYWQIVWSHCGVGKTCPGGKGGIFHTEVKVRTKMNDETQEKATEETLHPAALFLSNSRFSIAIGIGPVNVEQKE